MLLIYKRLSPQKEDNPYNLQFQIENESADPRAEIIYAGGGNTVILFGGSKHRNTAKKFVYELSKRVLEEAPGLILYAAHQTYKWGDNLSKTIAAAMKEMGRLKSQHPVYHPTLGLSVTATCASTGLPANGEHLDPDKSGKPFDTLEAGNGPCYSR